MIMYFWGKQRTCNLTKLMTLHVALCFRGGLLSTAEDNIKPVPPPVSKPPVRGSQAQVYQVGRGVAVCLQGIGSRRGGFVVVWPALGAHSERVQRPGSLIYKRGVSEYLRV